MPMRSKQMHTQKQRSNPPPANLKRRIDTHARSGQHELKDEEIEEMRLKRKSTKLRENKSGKKKLRSCPIKSCNWEGYRLDYHLPHKHKVQKACDPANNRALTS
ncbi:hypothetical protein AC249_AIPGENE16341 [Exaiptasia diaphana]|nr:hypothetical protein AC249_AIPGENE16341 [Exaiptasia diaphana]